MSPSHNEFSTGQACAYSPTQVPGWKRVLDIVLVVLALPVILPLTIVITLLIRFVSSGPVIFKQERVGHCGRRFMCFKFRTMIFGADTKVHLGHLDRLMDTDAPMVKMDARGDSRVIPCGLWLRSSGLDEIPQVFNVLRGDMSLVGPRPCLPYEYDKHLPWQKERYNTLPGLTGLWQVSGKNNTTFIEMIHLDLDYGKRKSLWLDIKIMLKTIPAMLVQMHEIRTRKKAAAAQVRPQTVTSGH